MIVVEKQRSFFGRWIRRIAALLIVLALLLGLAFVGITLVLRSSIPQSIATSVATGALRLDVEFGALNVGWDGDVEITDLKVRLPSSEGENQGALVLEVPRILADLGPLPMVAFTAITGGTPMPEQVTIESPTIYMTEDAEGQWTLIRAAELLTLGGGGGDPAEPASPISLPALPDIAVTGGTLIVRNNTGEEAIARNITVAGNKTSPLIYEANLTVPHVGSKADYAESAMVSLAVELLPANGRKQQATLIVDGIERLAQPFIGVPPVRLKGTWNGGFTSDGGVAGVFSFDKFTNLAGIGVASGVMNVETNEGALVIRPDRLVISNVPQAEEDIELLTGSIRIGPDLVMVNDLLATGFGGDMKVERVSFIPSTLSTNVLAEMRNVTVAGSTLTGRLQADLWEGSFGEPRGLIQMEVTGTIAGERVEQASMAVRVEGHAYRDFNSLDLRFSLPESRLVRGGAGETTPLPPIEGLILLRLADENPYVELATVDAIDARGTFNAKGKYFLPKGEGELPGNYNLSMMAKGWPLVLPRMQEPLPLDIGATFTGEIGNGGPGPIEVTQLFGKYGDIHLQGEGRYRTDFKAGEPPPLALELNISRREAQHVQLPSDDDLDDGLPGDNVYVDGTISPASDDTPLLAGDIDSSLTVTGTLTGGPIVLVANGTLTTRNFVIGPYALGDIESALEASVIDERLTVDINDAELLGAVLSVNADVPFDPELPGKVVVDLDNLDLFRASSALAISIGGEPVTGTVDVDLTAMLQGFDLSEISADGVVVVDDMATFAGDIADRIELTPRFANNVLTIPIVLRKAGIGVDDPRLLPDARMVDGELVAPEGIEPQTMSLVASLNLRNGMAERISVRDLKAVNFPVVLAPEFLGGEVAGAVRLTLDSRSLDITLGGGGDDAPPISVEGNLNASVQVLTGPTAFDVTPFANLNLAISANRRRISLDELDGELVNIGEIYGGGYLELIDLPGQSNIWIQSTVKLDKLAERLRLPEGGQGSLDVAISVQPAPGDRPKGEVLADLSFSGADARWRTVTIERGQVLAYLSRVDRADGTKPTSQYDFTIITTERIRIFAAGGMIEGYVKYRDRGDGNGGKFVQATLTGQELDLLQLGPIVGEEQVAGDLDFNVIAYGPLKLNDQTFTRLGDQEPTQPPIPLNGEGRFVVSNGRLRSFNPINAILSLGGIIPVPARDSASFEFRLENGDLQLTDGTAYVDGVELRGNVRVENIFAGQDAGLRGQVVVLAQPLRELKLPFFAQAQEVFDAVQASAFAVELHGTIGEPRPVQKTLAEIGEVLGVLLGIGPK